MYRPEAIINTSNLEHNVNYIKNYVGKDVTIMPVIKANAYGHGVVQICKILYKCGIKGFCVALLDEVLYLRQNNINHQILHLGSINHIFHKILLDKNLLLTINDKEDILFLDKIGKANNHQFRVHIKIDTGMTRLGILDEDTKEIIDMLHSATFIKVEGVYTQLSSADEDDQSNTILQREKFIEIANYFSREFNSIKFKHFTPSAGILKDKDNHFNMVRPGLSLYGVNNVSEHHPLKPVLSIKAPVCLIKNVKKGSAIGYNRTFKNKTDMKMAIIQIGYADAVPLEFSNNGYFEFEGHKLQILGKVSMDLICVCIDGVDIKRGDKVTVFGGELTKLEKVLKNMVSTPYSVLTGITSRVKRVYN